MASTLRDIDAQTALPDWREELRLALRTPAQLVAAGLWDAAQAEALGPALTAYRMAVPPSYAALFDRSNLTGCPIFRQAVPVGREDDTALPAWAQAMSQRVYGADVPWRADALGDVLHLAAPRLTHRYAHRALLHVTTACAMYCRFCFRKAHVGAKEAALYGGDLVPALNYIAQHAEIREVILTGGDPLSMGDAWLTRLMADLAAIPHVVTIRLHSRMATTLPSRLTQGLWHALATAGSHQQVVLVSHFNHARELTAISRAALRAGARAGIMLLNQSALLAGVNDDAAVLAQLCQGLYEAGVVPYYLHHPDWTPGTWHFRVGIARGRALVGALAGLVSGPALPSYVLDVAYGRGKVRVMESCAELVGAHHDDGRVQGGLWQFRLPHTRAGQGDGALYLDLAPSSGA